MPPAASLPAAAAIAYWCQYRVTAVICRCTALCLTLRRIVVIAVVVVMVVVLMRSGPGLKVASPHWVKARAPIPPVKDGDNDDAGRAPDNNNNGRADDNDNGRQQQHTATRYWENNN
ncbi:hypothetical protein EDB89DRAFT_1913334 [Lactarius sanguifluus]|nr:hypothetical protein EDB89DRAFT_1913334 [Lactarius sanguifluus]